jgi:hypothetical protein
MLPRPVLLPRFDEYVVDAAACSTKDGRALTVLLCEASERSTGDKIPTAHSWPEQVHARELSLEGAQRKWFGCAAAEKIL